MWTYVVQLVVARAARYNVCEPGWHGIGMKMAEKAKSVSGARQYAYAAVGSAFQVIPRCLAHNCGADVVRLMTDLRSRHAGKEPSMMGLDGINGKIVDTQKENITDTFSSKAQAIKSAIESVEIFSTHS